MHDSLCDKAYTSVRLSRRASKTQRIGEFRLLRDLMAAYEYENTFHKGLNIPWGHFTQLFLNRSESYSVPITQLSNYRNTCHLRRVTSLLSGCDFPSQGPHFACVHHILTPTQGMTACSAAVAIWSLSSAAAAISAPGPACYW